jgi:hypothetical protein
MVLTALGLSATVVVLLPAARSRVERGTVAPACYSKHYIPPPPPPHFRNPTQFVDLQRITRSHPTPCFYRVNRIIRGIQGYRFNLNLKPFYRSAKSIQDGRVTNGGGVRKMEIIYTYIYKYVPYVAIRYVTLRYDKTFI